MDPVNATVRRDVRQPNDLGPGRTTAFRRTRTGNAFADVGCVNVAVGSDDLPWAGRVEPGRGPGRDGPS